MVSSVAHVNFKPLMRFRREVLAMMRGPVRSGPIGRAFGLWISVYRKFAQTRFARLSRTGGASWPRLKRSTVYTRRALWGYAAGTPSATAILDETGTLYRALFVGRPGSYEANIPWGVVVGYGGNARHPARGLRRRVPKLTIAEIAMIHQRGTPTIPARPIIVIPPRTVRKHMARIMEIAIAKVGM